MADQAGKTVSANDKIRIGCIGLGAQGMGNLNGFMNHPEVDVAAVCDVDSDLLKKATSAVLKKQLHMPLAVKDFRHVLDRRDIDAVVISTPDHWHALPFIMACEAGKDVFCEKPISHDIVEAQSMVGAAEHYKRVVQVNTMQRSSGHFRDAIDFVRAGGLGKVNICRAWICGSRVVGVNPVKEPPAHLDWDFWLGPSAKSAYHGNIHPYMWRYYSNWGTGQSGNWGAHMIDIVLLGMNEWHPLDVSSVGGRLAYGDGDGDMPDTLMTVYRFPSFMMQWEVHTTREGLDGGGNHGSEFIGEKGKLIVDRGGVKWSPYGEHPGPEKKHENADHIADFLDSMRTRGTCRSDIETMYYTTACCHLANLAYQAGRSIKWDGEKGVIVGDRKAMDLPAYRREYRKPWKLPYYRWNG
jgi:predicted dehydrogenase